MTSTTYVEPNVATYVVTGFFTVITFQLTRMCSTLAITVLENGVVQKSRR